MKRLLLSIALLTGFSVSHAQQEVKKDTSSWSKGALLGFNLNQTSLTNWAAGGENSFSFNALANLHANYKKDNKSWTNSLNLGLGYIKQGKKPLFKNDDKIDFSSLFGLQANKNWYYSAIFNFKSQFADGYTSIEDSVIISGFFAPAFTDIGLGFDFKPAKKPFTAFISPLTMKSVYVFNKAVNEVRYGLEEGRQNWHQIGGYIRLAYKKEIMKNTVIDTRLELYSNYLKNPQNIDVNWQMLISMKVNKYLSASLQTNLIYDDDILIDVKNNDGSTSKSKRIQFKEVLGIGLRYKI